MKKIFIMLALCLLTATAWADEQKKVSLSGDHTQEIVSLGYSNLIVTLVNPESDDSQAKVLIEVENLDETNTLIIFDRAYEESALKGLSKPIKFDKSFPGTKGKRVIDAYNGQMRNVMLLQPSADKYSLPTLTAQPDETITARLPIYFAKEKKEGFLFFASKKIVLLEKQVIELKIDTELKPSQEYLSLKAQYDALAKEYNKGFCNNSKHRPVLAKQIEAFQKKADDLKAKIDAAISQHGWAPGAGGYQRYANMKDDIDRNLDPQKLIRDCGRHSVNTGHQCQYCSWSLSRIYQEMDRIYRTIYNSSDRKATKASNLSKVNALYQCCIDANCTKHNAAWNRGGNDKNQIVRCYNRIQGL